MIYIGIAIYVLAALLVAHGIFKGIKRGIIGQSLRLGVNLIAATTAFLISSGLVKSIAKAFGETNITALLAKYGVAVDKTVGAMLSSIEPSTVASIVSIPVAFAIIPFLTIIIYIITKSLLLIPLKFVAKLIPGGLLEEFGKKIKLPLNKILGATVGVVGAFITIAIIVFPFALSSGVVSDASDVLWEKRDFDTAEKIAEYADPIDGNGVVVVCRGVFGGIYAKTTAVKTATGRVRLDSISHDGALIYSELSSLKGANIKALQDSDVVCVTEAVSLALKNGFFGPIVMDLVSAATDNIDASLLGITEDGPLKNFADEFIRIFASSTEETLASDIDTVLRVISKIGASGVMDGELTLDRLLEKNDVGKSVASEIFDVLGANPRFSGLCAVISDAAFHMVLNNSGVDLEGIDVDKVSSDLKNTIKSVADLDKNDFLTEEDYKSAVVAEVTITLRENGIDVDEKIKGEDKERFDAAVVEIVEELDIPSDVSDEEMLKIMVGYYEKYMATEGSSEP